MHKSHACHSLRQAQTPVRPGAVDASTQPQLLQLRTMLLRLAGALELPPNPLDDLIDRMGGETAVAELTGRKARAGAWGRGAAEVPGQSMGTTCRVGDGWGVSTPQRQALHTGVGRPLQRTPPTLHVF